MNTRGHQFLRRFGPATMRSAWTLLGTFLGRRNRRHLLVLPVLGLCIAVSETVLLLSIVRLLLLVVSRDSATTVEFAAVRATLTFGQLTWVAAAACGLSLGLRVLESAITAKYVSLAVEGARRAGIRSWFAADWEQVRTVRLGRLQQLLGLNAQNAAAPVQAMAAASLSLVSLVLYLVVIISVAPLVALLLGLLGAATAAVFAPLRRHTKGMARRQAGEVRELQLEATSYASLNRELHVLGVSDAAACRLDDQNRGVAATLRRLRYLQRLAPSLYQQTLLGGVLILVGLGRALNIDASGFGTTAVLGLRALTYVQQFNLVTQTFIESRPYLEELAETTRNQQRMRRDRGTEQLTVVQEVSLSDVGYEYQPGVLSLSQVTLTLQAGWTGVVGPSGGGKTTLVNLIAGLLQPTVGDYRVNGKPVDAYDPPSWASQFGLVSQEPILLRASVAENIAFHRPATEHEVRSAARLAAIEGEIDALPDGFATLVGDGHASLSGGQRQRIALARALLKRPSCLILDEATSALDAANERLIEESLAHIPPETLVIVVSHRRRLLERCTTFLVVEGGRISAVGSAIDVGLDRLVGAALG